MSQSALREAMTRILYSSLGALSEGSFQKGFWFRGFFEMLFTNTRYGRIGALFNLLCNQVDEHHFCTIETAGVDYV